MKFHWFHLMPYADLPEGFAEEHRSIWVDVDPTLYDPALGHALYHEYLDELEHAAAVGFDGICVNEHHSNGYGLMPSPNLMAMTLARNTRDAAIIVMGDSLALYNPPIRVAEEMAMIDVLSGGRLVAGFPVGTPMDTCYAYGLNPATLRDRYHEAHDLVMRAWAADEPFVFNGRFTQLRYTNPWPRPVQQPHPPVWIPGGGSIDTWEWCAQMDYLYAYLSYFGYRAGRATMDGYWAKMAELGQEPNPYQAGFIQFIGLADTDAEALELYREPTEYFYQRCLHVYPGFADPPGYKSESTVRAGVIGQIEAAARMADRGGAPGTGSGPGSGSRPTGAPTYEKMLEAGYVIVGSPTTVAEKLHHVATSLNVGHLMVLLQFGNMGRDLARMNTDLFASSVMPELHDLFDDQWEDQWWPRPLARHQRAARDVAFIAATPASRTPVTRSSGNRSSGGRSAGGRSAGSAAPVTGAG